MTGEQLVAVRGKWRHRLVMTTALSMLIWHGAATTAQAEDTGDAIGAVDAPELAQATSAQFDIAPQLLADGLALFGQQAGVQVSANGDLVRDVETSGVSGEYQIEDALQRLLAGTGLSYRLSPNGAITITSASQTDGTGAQMLSPILVEANLIADDHPGAADRANSVYVTSRDLQRRNPQDIKQVFAGQSEVSVGGSLPMNQKVYVNGVEETNLAVSIDGARQNNRLFHHSGTNLMDPSLFKAARVDPGVAPADAGPGALGGSIVYETVDAVDMLAPGRDIGGFIKASYDTNSGTFANDLSTYGRAQGFELLGYFKWAKGDDFEDGSGDQQHGTETDMRSFLLKAAYEANGHRFEVSGEHVQDDASRPFRANMASASGNTAELGYDLKRRNFVVNYEQPDATGLFDPSATVSYSTSFISAPLSDASKGETENIFVKLENDFNLSPDDTVTAGVDFFQDEVTYKDSTLYDDEVAYNFGAYGQARLNPLDPLRVSFGLRGDSNNFEGMDGTEFETEGVSGNASVAFDVNDYVTLNAGYANNWGGIKVTQSYHLYDPDYSPGLKAARSENYITGADFHYEGITLGAGLFRNVFDNVRNTTGSSLTNMSDFETRGYNLRAGYNWGAGFATLSYTDSDITVDGTAPGTYEALYLGAQLGRIFAFEAAHSLDDYGLTFGATADVALKNDDTEDAGGLALPGYEVVNLYTEYTPERADFLTLRLEINNLFDEEFSDRATYGQDYSSVEPLREPGRSVLLQAKATF
ncbi:TonB-dependent receptor [Thalassospira sp. MA62]|nr:TonB-dependent receptor [Thalassospira sp. MA62]